MHLLRKSCCCALFPLAVLSCLVFLATPPAFGQGGLGTILGTVTDASAASVPSAKVVAVNQETGIRTETITNDLGFYQTSQLNPGVYRIEVTASGFKRLDRPGIQVQVSDRITLNFSLEVGAMTESVQVTGEAPLLRTSDAQIGEVITNTMISNMPQLSRDPLRLLLLAGNVQGGGSRAEPGSDTRINGGRTVGIEYMVDGITAGTGLAHRVVNTVPSMETVAEFKVITNGVSAEYGRLSGGAVEVVTKGGSNGLHGQLFEYFQNDHLNASSWSQNALGGKKVKFAQNIFGGLVGGPIWIPKVYNGRNRTFFFFNYEGYRRREAGSLQTSSVPTEAERNGDFSQTVYNNIAPVLYDQNGTVTYDSAKNQWTRQTLLGDGKRLPKSLLSPVSLELLKYVPMPNASPTPGTSSRNNYIAPRSSYGDTDSWGTRLDHQFTPAQRFFGRFTIKNNQSGNTRWRGPGSLASETRNKEALAVVASYDWTLSPTLLLNLRAGATHYPQASGNLLPADVTNASIPMDSITKTLLGTNLPSVDASGTAITSSASASVTNATTYTIGASITKMMGRHTIKSGFQHNRYSDNFSTTGSGTFNFIASPVHQTAGVDFGNASDISNAYATAAFMIGTNNRATTLGGSTRANALNYYAGFVQDDIKVSAKLTLNAGIRWDLETPITERHDKLYFWDPDAKAPFVINPGYDFRAAVVTAGLDPNAVREPAWVKGGFVKGALRIANTPEFPGRKAGFYNWKHFAPRLGAAYQLDEKTVLRASFAQIYISSTGADQAYSGNGLKLSDGADAGWHASNDNMVHLISTWTSPYQPGQYTTYKRTNAAANLDGTSATSPGAFNLKSKMPYELTWSFGIQRELPRRFMLEATYNANLGRDLLGPDIIGRFARDLFNGGPAGQNARLYGTQIDSPTAGQTQNNSTVGVKQNLAILEMAYPYFGAFSVLGTNLGRSNYHALNLRLERRLSGGLFVLANYTFSKALDDVGGPNVGAGTGINGMVLGGKRNQTVDNITDIYGISPLDETHVLRLAFNYQLPIGRGKRLLGSPDNIGLKLLDHAVGGWELAGMGSFRGGRPITLEATTPNINNFIRAEWTYGNYASADPSVSNSRFSENSQVFYSTRDTVPTDPIRRFTNAKDAEKFTYGTLPPIFPNLRQPSNYNYDTSLMKAFYFGESRGRYLQVRMEGSNFFNIRGYGGYNLKIGTSYFGMITGAGNSARSIQMSARIVF